MSKSNSFLILLLISIFWIFDVHIYIANKTLESMNTIRVSYLNLHTSIANKINMYSQNIEYIQELQNQTEQNEHYKLLYEQSIKKIQTLEALLNVTKKYRHKDGFKLVTTLSYKEFNNPSSLILDIKLDKNDTIYPLLNAQNYASGIVVFEDKKSIAYLNENKACSYTVDIGTKGATGVMRGYSPKYKSIIIKHIPKHSIVKKGDLVVTNGLGNIFDSGIKVGVIKKVIKGDITLTATIDTFANTKEEHRYFYIYKK